MSITQNLIWHVNEVPLFLSIKNDSVLKLATTKLFTPWERRKRSSLKGMCSIMPSNYFPFSNAPNCHLWFGKHNGNVQLRDPDVTVFQQEMQLEDSDGNQCEFLPHRFNFRQSSNSICCCWCYQNQRFCI